jgi:tetratricopeptide (TPR) repeat protein
MSLRLGVVLISLALAQFSAGQPAMSVDSSAEQFSAGQPAMSVDSSAEQEESPAERQYREDYDRVQKVMAVTDPARRAEQLFGFIKARPESKVAEYAQGNYFVALEALQKAENFKTLLGLSQRYIEFRPKVPETYYFYGAALRSENRINDAMDALARCAVVRNPMSRKAREFLEFVYKSQSKGTLIGLDKILKKAQAEMGQ